MTAEHGAGKYDDLATVAREQSNARGVLLIVIDGNKGSGFSIQGDLRTLVMVPDLLENVAASVRALQAGETKQ